MRVICFDAATLNKKYEYQDIRNNSSCERCMSTEPTLSERAFLCQKKHYFVSKLAEDKKSFFIFCLKEAKTSKHAKYIVKIFIDAFYKSILPIQGIAAIQKNASEISVHNTRNLNAEINNKLLSLLKESELYKSDDKIKYIESRIKEKPNAFAREILSVLKSTRQIMNEYNVHDFIDPASILHDADFSRQKIHTLCVMSFYLFEQDFKEKEISLQITKCHDKVIINWNTAQTALAQLYDNCLKYCKKNTTIQVSFTSSSESFIEVKYEMTSLFFSRDESKFLTLFGKRGQFADSIDNKGRGIGMHIIQRMMDLNGGYFRYESNESTKYYSDNKPYSENVFILGFRKVML